MELFFKYFICAMFIFGALSHIHDIDRPAVVRTRGAAIIHVLLSAFLIYGIITYWN